MALEPSPTLLQSSIIFSRVRGLTTILPPFLIRRSLSRCKHLDLDAAQAGGRGGLRKYLKRTVP